MANETKGIVEELNINSDEGATQFANIVTK